MTVVGHGREEVQSEVRNATEQPTPSCEVNNPHQELSNFPHLLLGYSTDQTLLIKPD